MIFAFLIYWFILFVITYVLVEYGHKFLYDEVPKLTPVRVLAASLIMAGTLTWTHSAFDTMFTADLKWTALMALIWIAVYILILAFQPLHGLIFGLGATLVLAGIATIAVDTMTKKGPDPRTQFTQPTGPIRSAVGGGSAKIEIPKGDPAK